MGIFYREYCILLQPVEKNRELRINKDNRRADNLLAFLHWAKMKDADYNLLMNENIFRVFGEILGGSANIRSLTEKTNLSRPTLLKTINILTKNNFVGIKKKKPLIMDANLNDMTFFYINFHELSLKNFEGRFTIPEIPEIHSRELTEKLIKLHTYSTTVTEGNTATQEDVEKLFANYPVNLTPREITEILNTKRAVELLYKIKEEVIETDRIEDVHRVLMVNLVDRAGEFYYGRKRIIGSELKPPQSREEIETSINALLDFTGRYEHDISSILLACIVHFIFVTIHPFIDGNGRMGRILHSWIHLKNDMPLFVFDPNRKNRYFDALENGRKGSIDDFVVFCLKGMCDVLEELTH